MALAENVTDDVAAYVDEAALACEWLGARPVGASGGHIEDWKRNAR